MTFLYLLGEEMRAPKEHPTSYILHPTSYIIHPTSYVFYLTSYLLGEEVRDPEELAIAKVVGMRDLRLGAELGHQHLPTEATM